MPGRAAGVGAALQRIDRCSPDRLHPYCAPIVCAATFSPACPLALSNLSVQQACAAEHPGSLLVSLEQERSRQPEFGANRVAGAHLRMLLTAA